MRPRRPRSFLAFVPPLLAGAPSAAAFGQEKAAPELDAPQASSIARQAHGVAYVDGELWGVGPDYKVLFRDGGFEFTPALGRAAPRNFPLAFELESIERGGVVIYSPVAPIAAALGADDIVRYAHPLGIDERYEMRADGVEQSFVFAEPLPGSGELVVRGRIATELAAPFGEREELEFTVPDLGGVYFGAVTGIDPHQTAPGSLRYDGSSIELVLPAEFVDRAVYPLVLDPTIGGQIFISGGDVGDHEYSDVAFDLIYDLYLVVWQQSFSITDVDIRGQRIAAQSGDLLGASVPVMTAEGVQSMPTVANVRVSQRFLVAWHSPDGIAARAVSAQDTGWSSLSTLIPVSSFSSASNGPQACGDQRLVDDDALIVWDDFSAPGAVKMVGAQVTVPISGNPFVFSSFSVAAGGFRPRIAKSMGSAGRALVAYMTTSGYLDWDVYVVLLDSSGAVLIGPHDLATSGSVERNPVVDGDGTSWIVAYEDFGRISCRRVDYFGFGLISGPPISFTDFSTYQNNPAVCWTPGKVFVAFEHLIPGTDQDVYVKGIDPFDCGPCETTFALEETWPWQESPRLASKYSGGSLNDQVFATWTSGTWSKDIFGQFLEAFGPGGPVEDLGGHCGGGGVMGMTGPVAVGNPAFAVNLAGADPLATIGFLVLSPPTVPAVVCGDCAVIASGSFAAPVVGGFSSVALPLPCDIGLVGVQVDAQWIVLPTTAIPCPALGGVSASNRWRFTIGQ